MRTARPIVTVSEILILLLAMSACSQDDSPSTAPTTQASTSAVTEDDMPGPNDEPMEVVAEKPSVR